MAKKMAIRYNGMENFQGRSANRVVDRVLGQSLGGDRPSVIRFDNLPLEKLTPRSINQYSQTRIGRLAQSIRNTNNRLINPITVVRAKDLPADGEVMARFKANGVDTDGLEYIIVAGERRYRAFRQLQREENEKPHEPGYANPFDTITANILTPDEARSEQRFYEESNTEARQLTPEEALRHLEAAVAEVDTDEKKQRMLREMEAAGSGVGREVPEAPAEAAKLFRMDKYGIYYLQTELGIEGWTESSVRRYLSILNRSPEEVKEALYDGRYSFREAARITKFNFDDQRRLVAWWEAGDKARYEDAIDALAQAGKRMARKKNKFNAAAGAKLLRERAESLKKESEAILRQYDIPDETNQLQLRLLVETLATNADSCLQAAKLIDELSRKKLRSKKK